MKNTSLFRRFLSVVLVLAMVGSLLVPATAAAMPKVSQTTQELELIPMDPGELEPHKLGEISQEDSIPMEEHKLTDIVRVSIELEEPATLDMGYSTMNIAHNSSAMAYRHALRAQQDAMTTKIESTIGSKLDVKLNLTLLANIISAEVMYGDIDRIKAVDGVKDVYLENFYEVPPGEDEPDQSNATQTIGANIAWGAGYTGAGSRLAILDTGVDMVHQSFDGEALEYALRQNAEEKGMTYEAYVESLHLLTAEEIDAVSSELHSKASGEQAYHSIKIPYAYNYQNLSYEATHEFDNAGDHGSHVAGISAANRFIKVGDEFKPALEEVQTQGVAPDAQIINMDVFNTSGTTPASAYMAAIEDAIILGCDSANLSLGGSAGLGFDYNGYEKLLNKLVECGMVVAIAMGNDYMWYDTPCNSQMNSALYADDVNFHTGGSPGTFTNSLAVASSDNGGAQAELQFGERSVKYVEGGFDGNSSITTLAGQDLQYVFFDNTAVGEDEETGDPIDLLAPYADVIAGKVVLVSRGSSTFTEKVNAAGAAGAIACIVYNNQAGSISMLLDGLTTTIPAVSITQADAFAIRAMSEAVTDPESGEVLYLTGTMSLPELIQTDNMTQVSSFSSYGVPGTLVMKPEIMAPGGNIYSVYGYAKEDDEYIGGHDQYVSMSGTSMATPQVNGMAGLLAQRIREDDLCTKTGLSQRQLINSLLMSTAHPMVDWRGRYWPTFRVGSGEGNVADAVSAQSYILMDEEATLFPDSAKDGKVKAELGDDPDYTGDYSFSFTVYPLEESKEFTLRTDMFTQAIRGDEGYGLLQDTATMLINAETTYEVNDKTYKEESECEADVNMDGQTDAADAQAILDHITEAAEANAPFNAEVADVDGDGNITSYDAKLILDSLVSPVIAITEATEVTVHIKIDEAQMKELLESFNKGFYVEGYTYVEPVATAEGALDVVHSIPILGYCGSWTDPAMLDRTSVVEEAYGTGKLPYIGNTNTNYMVTKDEEGISSVYMGNPYLVEKTFPVERLAMKSNTIIDSFNYLLIRSATTIGFAVTDAEGKVLTAQADQGRIGAYYYVNGKAWQNISPVNYKVNKSLSDAGVQEGEQVTVGFYALPEYYAIANAKMNGEVATTGIMDATGLKNVLEAGIVGSGSGIQYNVTIDDTAPVITGALRDFITGDFTIKATDNNYIAYVAVMNKTATNAFAEAIPEQTQAGEEVSVNLQIGDQKLPGEIVLLVGDYAGNEAAYRVNLGASDADDISGSFFAFTSATAEPGKGNRMLTIEPETLTYNKNTGDFTGLTVSATTRFAVTAAEYVEGYLFMAGNDGKFYAMNARDMEEPLFVSSYLNTTSAVYDMAYNVQDKQLYVMGDNNTIYTLDLISGELTKVAEITITNPKNADSTILKELAIDGNGNFYSANVNVPVVTYGVAGAYSNETFLYTFTLNMVVDGKIENLAPVNNTTYGSMNVYNCAKGGSMAWDHNSDQLYMITNYLAPSATDSTGYNAGLSGDNALYVIDVAAGKATRANAAGETVGTGYNAFDTSAALYNACSGLVIVPATTGAIKPAYKAEALTVEPTELNLLKGMVADLEATITPWTLTDKSVTWVSNDESVATVNDGRVTAVNPGETTITVTTNAEPNLTVEVPVRVELAPSAMLRGVIWDETGAGMLSTFDSNNTNEWQGITEVGEFLWGGFVDDTLYGSTDGSFFAYDEDTNELMELGSVGSMKAYLPSDAAALPEDLADAIGTTDRLIGLITGIYVGVFNCDNFNPGVWNLSEYFSDDPLALITYVGNDEDGGAVYGVMTESGELYLFIVSMDGNLSWYHYGSTGLDLAGASSPTGNIRASMVYDDENGFLYVSYYNGSDDVAKLYAIDALDPSRSTVAGDFNKGVWPVVGLHEYEPQTDLVLKVRPTDVFVYAGMTANVKVRVKLGATNEYTAEVADPTVCSFENGVITGLQPGSTTITITTVDTNQAAGEHLSETINVEVGVKPYAIFDFESDPEEAGWTLVDADGDGNNWYQTNLSANSGSYSMRSESWSGSAGTLTPDNWMISPAIDLSEATAPVASFYVRCSNTIYNDKFQIYAGTAADPDAMTLALSEESIKPDSAWAKYSLDLSSFAGQSEVYVAIRHYDCTDQYYMLVDDFLVEEQPLSSTAAPTSKLDTESLADILAMQERGEATNEVVGGTTAINGEVEVTSPAANETTTEDSTVKLSLTEDEAVTNGLIKVAYDPEVLTFDGASSDLELNSVNEKDGIVSFAYASTLEVPAETELAVLNFSFNKKGVDTELTVTTVERNNNVAVEEDALVVPVHNCQITLFTDIDEYPYGTEEHAAIEWAYTHDPQITAGTILPNSEGRTFSPDLVTTRAMAMVFLWAANGKPMDYEMPATKFDDVNEGDWYYPAVMWALSQHLTAGIGNNKFGPDLELTRSQMLTFFWASEGKQPYTSEVSPYSDVSDEVVEWYHDAAIWAYDCGIETGEDGVFNASKVCTRLDTVVYLYRYFVTYQSNLD